MSARADDGFTLVEALVTLVLLGLMSALTVGVFQQLRSVRTIETRYQEESEAAAVLNYIAGELGRALPIPLFDNNSDVQQPLIGTRNSVRFVGVTRDGFRTEALREITFSVEEREGRKHLLRRIKARSNEQQTTEELLGDIDGFTVEFRANSTVEWVSEWRDMDHLPAAIRAILTLHGGERRERLIVLAWKTRLREP